MTAQVLSVIAALSAGSSGMCFETGSDIDSRPCCSSQYPDAAAMSEAFSQIAEHSGHILAEDGSVSPTISTVDRKTAVTTGLTWAQLSGGGRITIPPASASDMKWPTHKPPFPPSAARVTPEGRVWVQRSGAEGAAPVYDEFDEAGRLMRRIALARGSRVVGFGKGVVYVARTDEAMAPPEEANMGAALMPLPPRPNQRLRLVHLRGP